MRGKNTKFLLSCTAFLFLCMLACAVGVASARTIYVPDDYAKIQWAVDNASYGDTIFVRNGTYIENVVVNKSLTLRGEDRTTTIIDGGGSGHVIKVTANAVTISDFTVRNSDNYYGGAGIYLSSGFSTLTNNILMYNYYGIYLVYSDKNKITYNNINTNDGYGIYLDRSDNNEITDNDVSKNYYGIYFEGSDNNDIIDNNVSDNYYGIYLDYYSRYSSNYGSNNNDIIDNDVSDNAYGIYLYSYCDNNRIYHNNIIDNGKQAYNYGVWANSWNESYPIGGNYWSDHICTGNPSNGSQPYIIDSNYYGSNKDWYPFEDPDGWVIKKPDLTISSSDISFIPASPIEGEQVSITATIHNIGNADASNVVVQFFDGDPINGIQIGENKTITSIAFGKTETVQVAWDTTGKAGSHDIYVRIDPENNIDESNENNNQAFKYIIVRENKPPIASFTYTPENPFVNQTITFDASSSYDPDGTIVSYEWDFDDGNTATGKIVNHVYSSADEYTVTLTVTDNSSAKNSTSKVVTVIPEVEFFDTGPGTYPSIFGTHKGTIKPNKTIIAEKLYTYPCEGTGGHTEYALICNSTWCAEAKWEGYKGDWKNITFNTTVALMPYEIYDFTIITGSYPQIHHRKTLPTENGWINCTSFVDANGKVYYDRIPAIRLG